MRDALPIRLMLATATLVLGAQAAFGVWATWASGYDLSDTGFMYVQGCLAFVGAVGLIVTSLLYCAKRLNDPQYLLPSALLAALSLAASIWFWSTEVGRQQTDLIPMFFITPHVTAGTGWYLTIGSSAAALACLAAFAFESHRVNAPHEDHIHLEWRPEQV
jgi:hypothetical protein